MATRSTMADLIGKVRRMAGDKTPPLHFTDDELQDILDRDRRILRYVRLQEIPSYAPGGASSYLEFRAEGLTDFEGGLSLVDGSYNALTPATSDLTNGIWIFSTTQNNGALLSGAVYDTLGAAADALEQWATDLARSYDVADGETNIKRSQSPKALMELAAKYRARQPIRTHQMERSDVRRG